MAVVLTTPGARRPALALLADRDTSTRQMYAEFLHQYAFDTLETDDGREALAKAISQHPDVIVTETRLPGISGIDLCRLLRSDAETADIPVLFVTADGFEREINQARAAGAIGVLVKPCPPDRLAEEIQYVLGVSPVLCAGSAAFQNAAGDQWPRPDALMTRSLPSIRRVMLSHAYERRQTVEPPVVPVDLVCPTCDRQLRYVKSFIGGVSAKHAEQWDYFECSTGCGAFQYRQRTKKLRRVS